MLLPDNMMKLIEEFGYNLCNSGSYYTFAKNISPIPDISSSIYLTITENETGGPNLYYAELSSHIRLLKISTNRISFPHPKFVMFEKQIIAATLAASNQLDLLNELERTAKLPKP